MKRLFTILTTLALLCAVGCEEQGDDNVNPNDKPNTEQPGEKPDDGNEDSEIPDDVNPNDKTEQPEEKPDDGNEDSEIPDDAYITINKEVVTFGPDGGSIDIKVYSNYAWELTNNCDWVTTSVMGGEASDAGVAITLTADLTYDDREGTIVFSCGKARKPLVVSQSLKEVIIPDENSIFSVPAEGGNVIINYQTTVDCEVVIPEEAKSWITLAPATRVLVSYSTTLNVAENTVGERSAVVKVVATNNSELMAEYTITQETSYIIRYTTSDGATITAGEYINEISGSFPDALFGDATIVSNTYENGVGIMEFDRAVTAIDSYAFAGIENLTSITIPESVTSIGSQAFCNCSSLAEFRGKLASSDGRCLIIDGVLKSFAPAGLTGYAIPDSVTSIGESAFHSCSSLASVTIPDSVTSIGEYAFSLCTSLPIENNVRYAGTYAVEVVDNTLTTYTLKENTRFIGTSAFWGCSNLASITIPDSVTSIGKYAFHSCSSLAEFRGKLASSDGRCLIIDGVLKSFAPAGLTEYTIPDGVTSIGERTFYGCSSLASITIPDGVTSIGDFAFYQCSSLTSVYCKPTTPPSVDYYMFDDNASERKIYVPAESVKAYKTAKYWNYYADDIVGYDFE